MRVSSGQGGGGAGHRGGPSAGAFLTELHKFLGDPYVYGAAGPSAFDCSGLVWYSLRKIGINAPRTSEQQWGWVQHITAAELRPGDLVFEQWPGDSAAPGHVAIYTGNGKIEEAPQPGQPVHIIPWSPGQVSAAGGRVVGYGRIPGLGGAAGAVLTSFPGSGILGIPGDVTHAFTSAGTALDWLLQPNHWVRIICGALGLGATGAGVIMLGHTGGDVGNGVGMGRTASLPLGILLVGTGGVLLFVAFHNLPSSVVDLPTLLAYLVESIRGKTPIPADGSSSSSPDGGSVNLPAPILLPPL